ncbi:hypothetical protein 44RRORF011c [Aeromonas phage 44RR2.8t]|uniref:Uncharacterized protein n=2 Tax=Biquartavirus 44RR2 TaxID=115987 RepID=Q6U9U1_9CAUD|nr:MazG-like pyrophosphatase [Aeromonas phage 44RR2.8t]AAQ81330.1 hypothetical protein 44RRORF011c [Aeromonas phage 44RR2.8t]APU00483.1 hypothetical protein [Aeromonas phage 44RR2.8t.2]
MIRLKCNDREGLISFINKKSINRIGRRQNRSELIEAINTIEHQSYRQIDGIYHAVTPMSFKIEGDLNVFFDEVIKNVSIDLSSTFTASAVVPTRNMGFVMGKLVEEVGEFAKSINQPERCDERPVGEAADVINCVMDMLYLQYSEDNPGLGKSQIVDLIVKELNLQLNMKAEKWVEKACSK